MCLRVLIDIRHFFLRSLAMGMYSTVCIQHSTFQSFRRYTVYPVPSPPHHSTITQREVAVLSHTHSLTQPTNKPLSLSFSLSLFQSPLVPASFLTQTMHPPLDRLHPDCQAEIKDYQNCQANKSFLNFFACDKLAVSLDRCLKQEKARLLKKLNVDMEEKRQQVEDALQVAGGHQQSFEEFLQTDPEFQKEMKKAKNKQGGRGNYQTTAQGGHVYTTR